MLLLVVAEGYENCATDYTLQRKCLVAILATNDKQLGLNVYNESFCHLTL